MAAWLDDCQCEDFPCSGNTSHEHCSRLQEERDSLILGCGFAVCALLILCLVIVLWHDHPPLMGIGCEGTDGAIYAFEESDFPDCSFITTVN